MKPYIPDPYYRLISIVFPGSAPKVLSDVCKLQTGDKAPLWTEPVAF